MPDFQSKYASMFSSKPASQQGDAIVEQDAPYQSEYASMFGDPQPPQQEQYIGDNEEPVRLDAEGESYELPEGWEGLEDTWLGDFFTDLWREGRRGYRTARASESTAALIASPSEANIAEFVQDQEAIERVTQSAEMRDFQATVDEEGGGLYGIFKGILQNPTMPMQVIVSSMAGMVNAPALAAGATTWGGVSAAGAVGGPIGAAIAQVAAIPAGIGALSGVTDGLISYTEFMREELQKKGLAFNEENVQEILGDKEAMATIRSRATARGVAVGVIDGLTAGIGKGLTGRLTSKFGVKGGALAISGIESVGGATGEAVAQQVSGQETNLSDIVLEGIAEVGGPGTISNVVGAIKEQTTPTDPTSELDQELDNEPGSYTVNDQAMSRTETRAFYQNASAQEIATTQVDIADDPEMQAYAEDRKRRAIAELALPPDVNNPERLVSLQVEIDKLQGKKDEASKLRLKELKKRYANQLEGKKEEDGIVDGEKGKKSVLKDTSLEPLEAPTEPQQLDDVDADVEASVPDQISTLRAELAKLGDEGKSNTKEWSNKLAELHKFEMLAKRQGIASPESTPYYNLERERQNNPNFKRALNLKKFQPKDRAKAIEKFTEESKNLKKGTFDGVIIGANPNSLRVLRKALKGTGLTASFNYETGGEAIIHHESDSVKNLVTVAPGKYAINAPATMLTKEARQPGPRTNDKTVLMDEVKAMLDQFKQELANGKVATLYDIEQLSKQSAAALLKELQDRFGVANVKDTSRRRRDGRPSRSFEFTGRTKRKRIGLSITEKDETALKANKSFLKRAIKKINRAFPKLQVIAEYDAYFDALRELQQEGVNIPSNAKGFAYKGKVYINPLTFTKDTPFHEVAHLTIDALAEDNPDLFIKGWELLRGTEFDKAVDSIEYYRELKQSNPIAYAKEVMANALGKGTANLFESFEKQSAWERFKQLVMDWLNKKLKLNTDKSIDNLTLDDWINIGAKGILQGTARLAATEEVQLQTGPSKKAITWARQRTQYQNFTKKGTKPEKGWSLEPKWAAIIEEKAKSYPHADIEAQAARKAQAKETGKAVEPEVAQSDNPTFNKASKMFANFKKNYRRSYARNRQKYIADIPDAELAEAVGRVFQDFSDTDTSLADAFGRLGQRALPKKPEPDMSRDEFRLVQYSVGAAIVRTLIQNGVLDVKYDYQTTSNVIEIVDTEFVNKMANAVAQMAPRRQDYRTVYLDQKPPQQNQPVGQDGLNLNSRYHRESQMTRETHPKVYEVKDKADQVPYELDTEYVDYLTEFFNEGLLDDKKDTSGPKEKAAKKRAIKTAIENLNTLKGQVFHEAHNFVHNGRVMSASTDVTHQGAKSTLAAFTFANKKPMGKKGWEWTQILAQDVYGYSGGDLLADRLQAAKDNTKKWMKWAADPRKYKSEIMAADTPMLFLRYILEMKKAIDSGNPETFESGLPNHMDATTSGIQFLAAMTKDQEAARIANLTATDQRSDSYSEIVAGVLEENANLRENASAQQKKEMQQAAETYEAYEKDFWARMNEERKKYDTKEEREQAEKALKKERASWRKANKETIKLAAINFWSQEAIRKKFRKIFKKPVMTKYYSSTKGGMAQSLLAQFGNDATFAGINLTYTSWLAGEIDEAANRKLAGPGKVMNMLREVAKEVFDVDAHVQYNNPVTGYTIVNDPKVSLNERVYLAYDGSKPKYQGKDGGVGNIEVSVAVDTDTKSLSKQQSQIAPLVVHSLDASLVQWLFLNTDFDLQTIHDSFAATPADTQALYEKIREGFYEIMKGEPLLKIIEQMYENAGFENFKELARARFDEVNVGTWNPAEIKENQFGFSAGVTDPKVADKVLAATFDNKQAIAFEGELNADTAAAKADQTVEESKPCKI